MALEDRLLALKNSLEKDKRDLLAYARENHDIADEAFMKELDYALNNLSKTIGNITGALLLLSTGGKDGK